MTSQAFVSTPVQSILVTSRQIGDGAIQTVNARELHSFLEVGKDFSTWIRTRIEQYGFKESQDFVMEDVFRSPNLGSENRKDFRGGLNRVEYTISLDMAKELSMVERNEKGRQARQYFIECERRSNSMGDTPDLRFVLDNMDVLRNLLQQHKDRASAYRLASSYRPTQKALPGHGKSAAERKREQRERDAEAALSGNPISVSQCLKVLTEPRRNDLQQQKTAWEQLGRIRGFSSACGTEADGTGFEDGLFDADRCREAIDVAFLAFVDPLKVVHQSLDVQYLKDLASHLENAANHVRFAAGFSSATQQIHAGQGRAPFA
jgi:phage anti-repressor protein